jgi:glycosyltransferase involved in cell wall biosynthesis
MEAPLVSIALVTRNGIATLPDFSRPSRQRVDFAYEVVAVDSGSTDGSAELLARKGRSAVHDCLERSITG